MVRVPLPSQFDFMLGLTVIAAIELAVLLRFWLRLRSGAAASPPLDGPSVFLLVPCAGIAAGFEENIRALFKQDYEGAVRACFVTPSKDDPAYKALEALLDGQPGAPLLIASGKTPAACSGKITDMLHALETVEPSEELLVFADSDTRVHPSWLRRMAGALADPAAGAATAWMLYIPESAGLGALLRMAWVGFSLPFADLMRNITGQSMAMRRADFEERGVAALWSRSLLEDLALTRHLRGWDKEVRLVHGAITRAADRASLGEMLAGFNKWMVCYRVYDPFIWVPGVLLTAFKTWALVWALMPPFSGPVLALLFGADALYLFLLFFALRLNLPDRFGELHPLFRFVALAAALAAPLLQLVFLINYAVSLSTSTVRWGPRRYVLRGPQQVELR